MPWTSVRVSSCPGLGLHKERIPLLKEKKNLHKKQSSHSLKLTAWVRPHNLHFNAWSGLFSGGFLN